MNKFILLMTVCLLSATGCETDQIMTHHNAHIGGYIGLVDTESESLTGLSDFSNISTYFYPEHKDYSYFVKKYIFEKWDGNGPSGKAQFWRENQLKNSDWIDQIMPGEGEVPFTKDIYVENGYMGLWAVSWQQPWLSWQWKIHKVSSSEIILVNEKDKYYFKITKGERIEAADAYDEKSYADKHKLD